MKRKIVKSGIATLTVSLPSKWVKAHGLNPGDELEVIERGPFLEIGTSHSKGLKRKTLVIKGTTTTSLTIATIAAYRAGYDEIELKIIDNELLFRSKEVVFQEKSKPEYINTLEFINRLATYFVSLEVIYEDKGKVIIRDMSTYDSIDYETIYHRISALVTDIGEVLLKCLDTNDQKYISSLSAIEFNINKLCNYYMRCLAKSHFPNVKEDLPMYIIISDIENCVDKYWDIIKLRMEFNYTYNKKNNLIFVNAVELINRAIRIAPRGKPQETLDFYQEIKKSISNIELNKEPDPLVIELKQILIIVKEIIHYSVMRNV